MAIDKDRISRLPIWVHFYNIPLEYWNQEGLSYIASMIGKPLHVDKMTASRRRITYARICIEIDAMDDWITSFELESVGNKSLVTIYVEYQWTPSRCSSCKCFGHDCHKKEHTTNASQQWIPNKKLSPESLPNPNPTPSPSKDPLDENQWIEVKRKGKTKVNGSMEVQENLRTTMIQGAIATSSPSLQISNSFNELIPYVYATSLKERNEDSPNAPLEEESKDRDSGFKECVEDDTNATDASTLSSRQRKKEAKRLFSATRPKGRHRFY